jgi:hypothetical protein
MINLNIFDCDDYIQNIKNKFDSNHYIINHFKDIKTIDHLIMNIMGLVNKTEFNKKNNILLFYKPDFKYIKLFGKNKNEYRYIDKSEVQTDIFLKEFVSKLTSKDGSYEAKILDMKFDFLLSFLQFQNIKYQIIDKNKQSTTIQNITNNII